MNTIIRFIVIFIIVFHAGIFTSIAQVPIRNPDPTGDVNPIGSSTIRDTTTSEILPLDTPVAMAYVLITDPGKVYSRPDTFVWEDNRHQPLHFYQAHLGNYGSPARMLIPSITHKFEFHTGWDQYDPYFIHPDSFRYYVQEIPIAKIKYSQAGQEDNYLTLNFGRRFAKGMSLSLTYNKINQLGEFGRQHQINSALGVGVWHNAPSQKYDAFYQFISNGITAEDNGGIIDTSLLRSDLFTDPVIPVFVTGGMTTHKHRLFGTRQILHLIEDSSDIGIDLWMHGQFATSQYKYVDESTDADTTASYYTSEFLVDTRGIRQFVFQREYTVEGGVALPWKAARSRISTSLRYRLIDLEQEPVERKINELYWQANGFFNWIDPLTLRGQLSYGLGQADGNFSFIADGSLHTGLLGHLQGYWSIVSRKPYLIESSLYVNQQLIYDVRPENPLTTEFGVGWNWAEQNLMAGIRWTIYDNYIYFGEDRKPAQINESFSIRRFHFSKTFDFKWIGVKGNFYWQPDPREELALPELLYEASLYGRFKLFKRRATIMPGLDVFFHDGYRGVSYFPVTGRYHLLDSDPVTEYFRVDAALGVHINFLKIFIRMEDVLGIVNSPFLNLQERELYQAHYYPHYAGYLRIGIQAGFFN